MWSYIQAALFFLFLRGGSEIDEIFKVTAEKKVLGLTQFLWRRMRGAG